MVEIGYMGLFVLLAMLFCVGFFLGRFLKFQSASSKEPDRIICDYKLSKDYERLYKLLNNGNNVLIKTKGAIIDRDWYYNAWKSHRKEEYYLGGGPEVIESLEKFILYCKFKEIEFLDFIQ
jgi:hypothetical protein